MCKAIWRFFVNRYEEFKSPGGQVATMTLLLVFAVFMFAIVRI